MSILSEMPLQVLVISNDLMQIGRMNCITYHCIKAATIAVCLRAYRRAVIFDSFFCFFFPKSDSEENIVNKRMMAHITYTTIKNSINGTQDSRSISPSAIFTIRE